MKCDSVGILLEQIGRNNLLDMKLRARALDHARVCRVCGVRLANERMLTAGLVSVTEEHVHASPSRAVEAAVMQAYDDQFGRGSAIFRLRFLAVAMAACIAIVLLVRVGQSSRANFARISSSTNEIGGDAIVAAAENAFGDASKGAFLRIPFAETLVSDERTELQRVEMSRGALAALGVPGSDSLDPEESVNAEVVVGEDGIPRAVRLLN